MKTSLQKLIENDQNKTTYCFKCLDNFTDYKL